MVFVEFEDVGVVVASFLDDPNETNARISGRELGELFSVLAAVASPRTTNGQEEDHVRFLSFGLFGNNCLERVLPGTSHHSKGAIKFVQGNTVELVDVVSKRGTRG